MAQCFVEWETGLVLDMAGNRLSVGSVIMCKLTPFAIMKDGNIDYMGGSKMEMVSRLMMSILSSSISRSRNFTWKGVRDSSQVCTGL